jgi:hypothetical protein
VTDPDALRWEWYVKTADAEELTMTVLGEHRAAVCCAPEPAPSQDTGVQAGGCC